MDYKDLLKEGVKCLRNKEFEKAVELLEFNNVVNYSTKSHEIYFSALFNYINHQKTLGESFEEPFAKLQKLVLDSETPEKVFGLTFSTITKSKLTKRYKILALLFHPDKGLCSGETFTKIQGAYQELGESLEKGIRNEDFHYKTFAKPTSHFDDYKEFKDFKDNSQSSNEVCCGLNPFLIFSLCPMLMLLFISLYSSFNVFSRKFSLEKTFLFTKEMYSKNYGVQYWVDPGENEQDADIETYVEEEYMEKLVAECQSRFMRKAYLMELGENSDSPQSDKYFYLAGLVDISACEILESLNFNINNLFVVYFYA